MSFFKLIKSNTCLPNVIIEFSTVSIVKFLELLGMMYTPSMELVLGMET